MGQDHRILPSYIPRIHLFEIAETYGEEGRQAYIRARWTFDLVFPLVYGGFLISVIGWLLEKSTSPESKAALVDPGAAARSGAWTYLENTAASLVMGAYPTRLGWAAFLASGFTLIKWIFVYGGFVVLVAAFIIWLADEGIRTRQPNNNSRKIWQINILTLLRNRPGYRNLWLASMVSLLGDWFNTIASVMIVNRYTETDLAISWILIARTLPRFLLVPFSGALADRVNRKLVMVVADLLRAGIVLSFLWVDRPERVWLIYVLTVAQFVAASFFEPASSAITPSLVEGREELMTANVLSSVTWSAMLAIGAALGGVFAGIFGAQTALVADAVTFLMSAAFLIGIRDPWN